MVDYNSLYNWVVFDLLYDLVLVYYTNHIRQIPVDNTTPCYPIAEAPALSLHFLLHCIAIDPPAQALGLKGVDPISWKHTTQEN